MFYRAISLVLVAALAQSSMVAQDQPQSSAQAVAKMQEVLHKAQAKDKAVNVILNKNIDNQKKFSGKVSQVSATGFDVTDEKSGKTMKLNYEDVQQVKQKGMSKGTKILIAGLIVVAAAIGIGFAVACSAEGGPHC